MDIKEELIINQLREGSERAYKYLYDTYYVSLCHTANEYLKDRYQAEIIVGDIIFHLWEIRDNLKIETSLLGYLITSVRNRCINHLSLSRVRHEVPVSYLVNHDGGIEEHVGYATSKDEMLDGLLEKELDSKIKEAISFLSSECKAVFEKSRFENKNYKDISEELGISVNTVKYHIKQALRLLRHRLGKYMAILFFLTFNYPLVVFYCLR